MICKTIPFRLPCLAVPVRRPRGGLAASLYLCHLPIHSAHPCTSPLVLAISLGVFAIRHGPTLVMALDLASPNFSHRPCASALFRRTEHNLSSSAKGGNPTRSVDHIPTSKQCITIMERVVAAEGRTHEEKLKRLRCVPPQENQCGVE